jgi:hypothetical protein
MIPVAARATSTFQVPLSLSTCLYHQCRTPKVDVGYDAQNSADSAVGRKYGPSDVHLGGL